MSITMFLRMLNVRFWPTREAWENDFRPALDKWTLNSRLPEASSTVASPTQRQLYMLNFLGNQPTRE